MMIELGAIAEIIADRGIVVDLTPTHGYVDDTLFTCEYVRFGKNPNLYYFKQEPAAAADFIEEGLATLSWSSEDVNRSLICEKDPLYFVCRTYKKFVENQELTAEDKRGVYFAFKSAMRSLLDTYSERYGLPHGGMDFKCVRAMGSCECGTGRISFNTDLIMFNPNYIKSVILHELCHIAHPNHRRKFWSCLQDMLVDAGLTTVTGYVVPELFVRRKDHYINIPVIPGGPDLRYRRCLPDIGGVISSH